MASLKEFRNRIASVKSTRKITSAMKMVAASKLRRAQAAAENARPYAERMEKVLSNLGRSVKDQEGAPELLVGRGTDQTHLVIVASSERGLCGGLNANIVKAARRRIDRLKAEGRTVKILCVGRKGYIILKRLYAADIVDLIELSGVRNVGYENARAIGDRVLKMFDEHQFDVATLFYARFRSVISQEPTEQQLIPTPLPEADAAAEDTMGGAVYEYEPDETAILADILPRNVVVQIFRALLENAASEQGARMTAMDNATRNATDMVDQLTLEYNRTRQAVITKELIEIISGADAV
ncbi:ATP synthase F1 subcomplex gamma subunit [Rhodothalassium salexigens DSM 2132]|uniref:ATP synthase gamma chain n=1 Tax=Rhodothalassium salexigens DSM 2132 TaxID=1188247 RepID=A0A4R2PIK1_RHOSA|nr:F0F1 ATP synthase subunit gamma [Rhodothalassium salexigens]MBB4211650.1 F-type H+-transporting ATPase subunit gamma [Rhodothalassium salexigens DSM 2132]MBK1640208.1 F0F1 ATP synthase subunit gamma [Rhodothalassium salexigens DSM 2132]TCP34418.1 ATP synthase F1 subcomplex gamma subunit [Rhodothalassium salexigens DSM 2132]